VRKFRGVFILRGGLLTIQCRKTMTPGGQHLVGWDCCIYIHVLHRQIRHNHHPRKGDVAALFSRSVGFCHGVGSDMAPGYGRTHGQSALSTNSNRDRIGMELGRTDIETLGT